MSSKIKVLQIIQGSKYAGGEKVAYQIAKGLDRQKYDSIVACYPNGIFADMLREAGVEVFKADMCSKYNILTIFRLAKFMRQRHIDIVHTHGSRANFYGRLAARIARVPAIISTIAIILGRESHADVNVVKRKLYIIIDKLTSGFVDKFLVLSEIHRNALANDYNIDLSRIEKIYNGIELGEYNNEPNKGYIIRKEMNISQESQIVGFIGRLAIEKGLSFLLQAFPKVITVFPDVKFLIVGDGSLRVELESLAERLNTHDNCIFTGFRKDIPNILSAIDIFTMSSLFEGMPMVILEAMASSKPVISTDVGGISELVVDGETGILVPPQDPDALAEAIITLLKDKQKAKQMGIAGRKRVEEYFDVKVMVRRTEEVYEELIKEKLIR